MSGRMSKAGVPRCDADGGTRIRRPHMPRRKLHMPGTKASPYTQALLDRMPETSGFIKREKGEKGKKKGKKGEKGDIQGFPRGLQLGSIDFRSPSPSFSSWTARENRPT